MGDLINCPNWAEAIKKYKKTKLFPETKKSEPKQSIDRLVEVVKRLEVLEKEFKELRKLFLTQQEIISHIDNKVGIIESLHDALVMAGDKDDSRVL